jgi:microcystin-dependent protein
MAQPYLGEIEIFAFGFAPKGWAICAGQTLPINQNQALFALLGTTYGGNGTTTFNLPDLRGRLPMGQGNGNGLTQRSIGETGGEPSHTLLLTETPSHNHGLAAAANVNVSTDVDTPSPTVVLSQTTGRKSDGSSLTVNLYAADPNPGQAMAPVSVGATGGQPHANLMPFLALNFCIAMSGIFPSRN